MRRAVGLALLLSLCGVETAAAQEGTTLADYYRSLADRRLLAAETGSIEALRELVQQGEALVVQERWDEAALVLWEATESPRFADFAETEEMRQAEFMLAGALQEMGALRTAYRVLERILARGPSDPYFGPAYRRAVDVALAGADLAGIVASLEGVGADPLPPDAANELRYLRGRERYDADDLAAADAQLAEVTRRSRFYANAQYLRGVIAARRGALDEAEARFCSIATTPDTDRFTFYVDRRYFEIRDLTWLALGRVAHEGRRAEDAFYYYFQVPNDSERVSEALFEAAWSMYEGGDAETAVDLLDQLGARFPSSPFVDEAALLRGYVHLARCEFEEADRLFVAFAARFEPIRDELDRILASPSRRARIFEELLEIESRPPTPPVPEGQVAPEPEARELLLGLLRVDPTFFRLYAEIRTLDAEAARSASVADQIAAIEVRLSGSEAPEAAASQADAPEDEAAALARDLAGARAALRAMTDQLDTMRRAGAARDRLEPLEQELRGLGDRVEQIERSMRQSIAASGGAQTSADAAATDLEGMLRRDRRAAYHLPARAAALRARMIDAANDVAVRSITELRDRLAQSLRRARIGRIDAVMGSKRRIEIQIESLAAGRFPAELQDPLRIQGLLRDDEEYWPFEGEYWEDEYEEDEESLAEEPAEPVTESEAEE
ncbi:tetratricopeptide repeat protein [Sandaracinus amylolyticus]|uniref:tetratricopeptide repeat protein n=1 Tax=Sandaracinus amylolyticus TaxID=927083 RepID=UPI001F37531C|nr:tetratricopeptide repeat protein [Sandaracinus amylolyticus]UJR78372.1 Tetratricopeptide repeat domain protein [Sandaracinus amylolyticus]